MEHKMVNIICNVMLLFFLIVFNHICNSFFKLRLHQRIGIKRIIRLNLTNKKLHILAKLFKKLFLLMLKILKLAIA
jgi:hypothetical protein